MDDILDDDSEFVDRYDSGAFKVVIWFGISIFCFTEATRLYFLRMESSGLFPILIIGKTMIYKNMLDGILSFIMAILCFFRRKEESTFAIGLLITGGIQYFTDTILSDGRPYHIMNWDSILSLFLISSSLQFSMEKALKLSWKQWIVGLIGVLGILISEWMDVLHALLPRCTFILMVLFFVIMNLKKIVNVDLSTQPKVVYLFFVGIGILPFLV